MGREDILKEAENYTTHEELVKNNWNKYQGESSKNIQRVKQGGCLDSNMNIWTYKHQIERGLYAKYKKDDNGNYYFISAWDEEKEGK